jgi:hypothetical protein
LDDGVSPFLGVATEERSGLYDFVGFFNLVVKVEVSVYLEGLCFKLVAITIVGVGLVATDSVASSLGIGRGVHCNVTYLKGVQSVKIVRR